MQGMYCIGLDVHKWAISYCVSDVSGKIFAGRWWLSGRANTGSDF